MAIYLPVDVADAAKRVADERDASAQYDPQTFEPLNPDDAAASVRLQNQPRFSMTPPAPVRNFDDGSGTTGDGGLEGEGMPIGWDAQPAPRGRFSVGDIAGGIADVGRGAYKAVAAPLTAALELPLAPFSSSARDAVAEGVGTTFETLSRPAAAVRSYLAAGNTGEGANPFTALGGPMPLHPFREATRGFVEPESAPTGMDIGAVQHLPDSGPQLGPVHITPRTVGAFAYDAATDPASYLPVGEGARVLHGAEEAAPAAAERFGATVGGGAARDAESMLSPDAAGSASQRLFGIKAPQPGLSRADEVLNAVKETLGIGVPENDIATPIMRERARVKQIADSQSARMGAVADDTVRVFETDGAGRITALPGSPTIQDVAARLPQYEAYLSNDQRLAMSKLRNEVEPFSDALMENGIDLRSRADVQDGGFYLPRGNAALEGADEPLKVGTGRGGAGGRKGFEKGATFDSMAEGLDAGYRYAPFKDAIQGYAKQAGDRAIDAYSTNALKATGLGEGVKDRLLREQPALANEWNDVNAGIASVRARLATAERRAGLNGGRVDELDRALADVQRAQPEGGARPIGNIPTELRNLKAEGNATFLGTEPREYAPPPSANEAFVRESSRNFGLGMDKVVQRLEALVPDGTERIRFLDTAIARTERRIDTLASRGGQYASDAKGLRAELKTLQDHYDGIAGEYRRAVEHAQATPRDQGSIGFAGLNGTTFTDEIANVANKYLNAEKPPTGRGTGIIRATDAFNGLMRGLRASTDLSFMGIQGLLGAVQHPGQYAKALEVAGRSLADPRALGAYIEHFDTAAHAAAAPDSRLWASMGLRIGGADTEFAIGKGLPRIGPAIQNAPVVKQSNRAFGYFGDSLRLGAADAMYRAREAAGKALTPDDFREIAKAANLLTGYSSRRFAGEYGALAQFAPRFFQSQLDLVGNALTQRGIVADESRQALGKLVGIGSLLTVGANQALGEHTVFDPRSPNFMRIRAGGQDISLFGPWDSLLRAVTSTARGDLTYIARTKASPLVSTVWDVISGKTFTGDQVRDNPRDVAAYVVHSLLPFSIQQIGEQSPGQTALGMSGLKASPLSPADQLDEWSRSRFGKDYHDLEPAQRAQAPADLQQARIEHGSEQGKISAAFTKQAQEHLAAADRYLAAGKTDAGQPFTPKDWRETYHDIQDALRYQKDGVYANAGTKPGGDPVLDGYFKTIDDSKDGTGKPDFDVVDAYRAKLSQADRDYIDRNTGLSLTSPTVQQYRADTKKVADSGYWDISDAAAKQVGELAGYAGVKDIPTLRRAAEEQYKAQYGDDGKASLYGNRIVAKANTLIGKQHLAFLQEHKDLIPILAKWGYGLPNKALAGAGQ